ncbi:hypothetical protein HNQ60_002654 [Povalibacter uvarum]|uniref:DUF2785 domain-containing protein n=1 Tax=Povalibacter uvarum TaxID=732238 RepID=A0A841HLZ9_9GAMM|nr:DUF2785 domain-containing protein [Povalibacter uvarum]MBB6093773.1 hypothetical protein [Povalibacter uvarum]
MRRTFLTVAAAVSTSKFVLALALLACCKSVVAQSCPPAEFSRERLLKLREQQFNLDDSQKANELAMALLPCLASEDPQLRDAIAYEAIATWARGKQLAASTARDMLAKLLPQIAQDYPEGPGFTKPFSALVLAEIARMDRIEPFLDDAGRKAFVAAAASYVGSVDDYRGYDEAVGWRHGVAHGADLLMQLALNPRVDAEGLRAILDAVAIQVSPARTHFYIYGESARLARPIVFAARRQLLSASDWQSWLARITAASPLTSWDDAFSSQTGLAKRHNTQAFLTAVFTMLRDEPDAQKVLREPLVHALSQVP